MGQRLVPGEVFGRCGRRGGWDCAHLHLETCKGEPRTGPWQWPYGWSRAQVEDEYWNPSDWWNAATGLVYAEAGKPPTVEVIMAMNDWQLTNWVLATLYEWAGLPFNPDSGLTQGWVEALRAGVYAGPAPDGGAPLRGGRRHWSLDGVRGGAAALPRGRRQGQLDRLMPRVPKTHCARGHPFDEANTHVDSKGRRSAGACKREARAGPGTGGIFGPWVPRYPCLVCGHRYRGWDRSRPTWTSAG